MSWRKTFVQTRGAFNLYRSPTNLVCMVGRVGHKDHPRLDKAIENIDFFSVGLRGAFKSRGRWPGC